MSGWRLQIGRQVRVVGETADGLQLEGSTRLKPGQIVEIVPESATPGTSPVRRACVMSWAVTRLGSEGPTYSGHCRWH